MTAPDVQRDLGRAEGRLTSLEHSLDEIKASLESQEKRLGRIETMLAEVKGGWRVLASAGAVGAGLMALLIKILPQIPWGR